MKQGNFIVLDGGEGAGKGTILQRLKAVFPPPKVLFTREPGGSIFADDIRKLILSDKGKMADAATMLLLFSAARRDHSYNTIKPAISSGKHVVSDRFDFSSWAYQVYAQENDELREPFWLLREIVVPIKPSLYLLLDVEPEEGLRRAKARGERNHFDRRDIEFHADVRDGYHDFLKLVEDETHTAIIDANRPIDQVFKDVLKAVTPFLA
ncbi:MAG: dTMP kinase [Minisyncoccia bacterium]